MISALERLKQLKEGITSPPAHLKKFYDFDVVATFLLFWEETKSGCTNFRESRMEIS